ncbi:MAG: adenylyl-sulfate kinase [Sulfuricurvum sp.]
MPDSIQNNEASASSGATNVVWHTHAVTQEERIRRNGFKPVILWFTGLSGSGKSTIANAVETRLYELNMGTYLLDGDNIRHGLNKDLGFSDEARVENIRRIGEVSKLFVDAGLMVITAFISPFCSDRAIVRDLVKEGEFVEVFIDTPLEICEQRDPKGLYQKARNGEIPAFTGISSPYESPLNPEIHIPTARQSVEESVNVIIDYLQKKGYFHVETN